MKYGVYSKSCFGINQSGAKLLIKYLNENFYKDSNIRKKIYLFVFYCELLLKW